MITFTTTFGNPFGTSHHIASGNERETVALLKACAKEGAYANAKQVGEPKGLGRTYRRADGTWGWELTTVKRSKGAIR